MLKLDHKEKPSIEGTVYDWIAVVARGLPEARFEPGRLARDGKTRVNVIHHAKAAECIVGEDKPADVVRALTVYLVDPVHLRDNLNYRHWAKP